jgi:hypothetical protein
MKRLISLVVLCGLLAFSGYANALSITPGTSYLTSGTDTSQSAINSAINSILGASTLLYSSEVQQSGPPTEAGALMNSYETTFSNTANDPADALIQYTGGTIVGGHQFLLVKDGDVNAHPGIPSWYLFDLTALGWDGMADLALTGFWPNGGAISHVSLYGTSAPVPEPATMLLLGSGILGLAGFRKKFKA